MRYNVSRTKNKKGNDMSDRFDFKEIDDEIVEVKTTTDDEKDDDGYEKICFLCHRPESTAGKMIDLPNNICVCQDCLQKSFDTMNNMPFDFSQLSNTPGIHFMNLSDLEGMMPKQQKIKKKKEGEPRKPIINIKDIPAPHKIKAQLDEYVVDRSMRRRRWQLQFTTTTNVWQLTPWTILRLKSPTC